MKSTLLLAVVASAVLSACSSVGPTAHNVPVVDAPQVTAIANQKLKTNFKRSGIKLEFDCGTISSGCNKAEPTAIEVTATAPSFGNSESNLETAYHVAEMNAKAKLSRFIKEDIRTTSVTTTISKNIEKANDQIKQRIANGEVTMDEDEAKKFNEDSNLAVRENINNVTRTVTDTVRMNSQTILKGVRVIDEDVVDRQTVKVTIRWDRDGDAASAFLARKFSN